jgi:hypothetical protein
VPFDRGLANFLAFAGPGCCMAGPGNDPGPGTRSGIFGAAWPSRFFVPDPGAVPSP